MTSITNFDVIFWWTIVGVLVGIIEHEYSPNRDSYKFLFGYIVINVLMWHATLMIWSLRSIRNIRRVMRRKK